MVQICLGVAVIAMCFFSHAFILATCWCVCVGVCVCVCVRDCLFVFYFLYCVLYIVCYLSVNKVLIYYSKHNGKPTVTTI